MSFSGVPWLSPWFAWASPQWDPDADFWLFQLRCRASVVVMQPGVPMEFQAGLFALRALLDYAADLAGVALAVPAEDFT